MKISKTTTEITLHSTQEYGNSNCSNYYFFSADVIFQLVIGTKTFTAVLQTGQSYYHGDISLPCEEIDYSSPGGCDEFIWLLDSTYGEDSLDSELIDELCSLSGLELSEKQLLDIRQYLTETRIDCQQQFNDTIECEGEPLIEQYEEEKKQEKEMAEYNERCQRDLYNS